MSRIKNMGTATMRFKEGIIVSGSAGSDTPALVVTGSTTIKGDLSDYVVVVDNDQGSSGHGLKVTSDGTGSGTNLFDVESASTTVLRVRGDGRVGIGKVTSLPAATLTVSSSNTDSDLAIAHKIHHVGDSDTSISFDADEISFEAGGTETLQVTDGAIHVAQYIRHIGDTNTLINFTDDKIIFKAGNKTMITLEEKASSPHEITLNDGSNNIDFVVKGNGSNQGNPGMKFDASTNKLGINGIGTPAYELEVAGDIGLAEYIYHRGDDDTNIRFENDTITLTAGASSGDIVLSGSVHAPNGITGSITKAASDLDGNRLAGGIYQLDDGLIQNPHSSYSRIYFPADDTLVETIGAVSTNYKIAPYNGELIKMQVKSIQDFTGKALTASLHVGTGTTNAYSSTPSVSVALNGQAAHSVYTFDFLGQSGTTFNEGNIFGFSLQLSENWAGNETIHFTSVVRFNPYA